MPTRNRGKHPSDDKLFAAKWHPIFKEAIDDFSFLMSRGYAMNSTLQIVGSRYKLNKRQRMAILRVGAAEQNIQLRKSKELIPFDLKNQKVSIDGFNLLILLESALSGAFIFKGRDGTYRDISSVHGTYKRVQQTEAAMILVGNVLKKMEVEKVDWYLDAPISNSGRLKKMLLEISEKYQFNWQVELVNNPDKVLAENCKIIVSSDGWVIDHAQNWFNLGSHLINHELENLNILAF
ncbi:MAG: DUF434 domain-containing protein [Saprospiraceae bacterium]